MGFSFGEGKEEDGKNFDEVVDRYDGMGEFERWNFFWRMRERFYLFILNLGYF